METKAECPMSRRFMKLKKLPTTIRGLESRRDACIKEITMNGENPFIKVVVDDCHITVKCYEFDKQTNEYDKLTDEYHYDNIKQFLYNHDGQYRTLSNATDKLARI